MHRSARATAALGWHSVVLLLPPPALGVRCSLSSGPNFWKRASGTCCSGCHCVPSGTAGHYEECHCYASQTTHGSVRKCP
ncbi:Snakin-2 protein [Nymphaea thermarum]|nr:Snakin-2 protein [Nymphaea thermarum]